MGYFGSDFAVSVSSAGRLDPIRNGLELASSVGDWTENFLGTRNLPRRVRDKLLNEARIVSYKKDEQVFGPDNIPDNLMFLYEGRIRVSQSSDAGREIVLYRVEAGDSCVLTTACMLSEEAYNAEGVAETDITAITLPKSSFDRLAAEEDSFRNFLFSAYSRRLIDLLRVVDDVAFGRMDVRLAERLLTLGEGHIEIQATHQSLANELGTAREVVSRILNDFQKRGLIGQTRGRITLQSKAELERLATSA